ncbi:MAG: S8 family peptidase [Saprospiraceae bacterium]|nr:S8 family peptidase [Saprospiraceae bacterium]
MTADRRSFVFQVLFLFCILIFTSPALFGQQLSHRQGELIVLFRNNYNAKNISHLRSSSKSVWNHLYPARQLGGCWNIWLLKFDHSRYAAPELLRDLHADDRVLLAQRNHLIQYRVKPDDPFFALQWHHFNDGSSGGVADADFDTDMAWDLCTGDLTENKDSIVICIIDDGLETVHEDLSENMWKNYGELAGNGVDDDQNGYIDDFLGWNTFNQNDIFESGKHGTAVTGLAAARGNNQTGISGVSWHSRIMFVAGGGDEANAIESYSYPLYFRRLYNQTHGRKGAFVVVTNTSWGADLVKAEDAPVWCAVYDSLGKEGILNVASTTNQNLDVDIEGDMPTTCTSNFLLTTTNITDANVKKVNAGYGKKSIDIGSYGESTYSTYINNSYRFFGGTSAAAPQVTGAIGLLYSLSCSNLDELALSDPPKAALEAKNLILKSIKPNASLKDITLTGGVMNVFNAISQVSPLLVEVQNSQQIKISWQEPAILPIQFRYRKAGNFQWKDTSIYSGKHLILTGLESCTDYELQFKNLCPRNSENYSAVQNIKSAGCCDPIQNVKIFKLSATAVELAYTDPSSVNELTAYLRKAGTTRWDTFRISTHSGNLNFSQLESCTAYELLVYSFCNGKLTELPANYTFTTNGCESCTSMDYCRRFRPSSELEWLHAIEIDQLSFISGNNAGYGNYVGTNQQWIFEKSKNYTIVLKAGYLSDTSTMVAAAWIDWNQDGIFDDVENIAIPTLQFKYRIQYNFNLPANARSGWTRMRVMLKFAEFSSATPLACFQSLEFGEYEEYCVYISNGLCSGIQSVTLTDIQKQSVQLLVSDHPTNDFIYAYRKLYSGDWVEGSSRSRIIQLNDLDSCSKYQFQIAARCLNEQSSFYDVYFSTRGTDCFVSTDEFNPIDGIKLYPNPCSDQLHVLQNEAKKIEHIDILDLRGKRYRLQTKINAKDHYTIETGPLPSGYYITLIHYKDGSHLARRFVKF